MKKMFLVFEDNRFTTWEEDFNICGVYETMELMLKDFPEVDKDRLDYPYEYVEFELNKKYENLLG